MMAEQQLIAIPQPTTPSNNTTRRVETPVAATIVIESDNDSDVEVLETGTGLENERQIRVPRMARQSKAIQKTRRMNQRVDLSQLVQ
jgi:hypothetical protein